MSKRLADAAALEERLAALQGEEWESGSDDDENDESVIPLSKKSTEAAVVDKREGKRDKKKKVANDGAGMSSVVYVGHIPHGFYEEQMRGFFSQFGDVERVRLSRSKKTGGSKGYAFIEFKDAADTKIVAESMDKYLLAGKQLVVKQLPVAKLHKNMWKGADEKFRIFPLRKQHAERVNKAKTAAEQRNVNARLGAQESKKRKKLAALGIEYDFPGYSAALASQPKPADGQDQGRAAKKSKVSEEVASPPPVAASAKKVEAPAKKVAASAKKSSPVTKREDAPAPPKVSAPAAAETEATPRKGFKSAKPAATPKAAPAVSKSAMKAATTPKRVASKPKAKSASKL